MKSLASYLSLYEMFRIVVPATYLIEMLKYRFSGWVLTHLDKGFNISIAVEVIIIFVIGLFIYSFDIPKLIGKIDKDFFPSSRIMKLHPKIDKIEVLNSYYKFYDKMDADEKFKTEQYSGFYHLGIGVSFVALVILIIDLIVCSPNISYNNAYVLLNIVMLITCSWATYRIYKNRFGIALKRHFTSYIESEEYQNLLKNNR